MGIGWECPRCGKVHAPWVAECDCHKPGRSVSVITCGICGYAHLPGKACPKCAGEVTG